MEHEGVAEEKSVIHWKPALPANYLQLTGILPEVLESELSVIKHRMRVTWAAVKKAEAAQKDSSNKDTKIVAKIACCFAHFNYGQQLAKLAQYYFFCGNTLQGFATVEMAKIHYMKVEELHWDKLIHQYYEGRKIYRKVSLSVTHSRKELMNSKFLYHFEVVLLHFLYFQAKLQVNILFAAEAGKVWLNRFLKDCSLAESINPTHTDLLFVKIIVLINFLSFKDKAIIKEFFRTTQAFIDHAHLADKKRKQIFFIDSVLKEMMKGSLSLSYRSVVPEALDDSNRHLFIDIFLETGYGCLKNQDLLIFYPGFLPSDLLAKYILTFNGIRMVFSIADFYKLLAHFRSITLRLQFTADPALNSRVVQALLAADIIDAEGNLKENLSAEDELVAKTALLGVYRDHFSNGVGGALVQTLSFKQLRENFLQQKAHIQSLYDGFAPEKTLFLVGRALEEVQLTSINSHSLTASIIALLHTAFNYRHQLRAAIQEGTDFTDLAGEFVTELLEKDQHTLMLQVTCPALIVEEGEWRHTVFVIFAKTPERVRIQVINTGLGAEAYHRQEEQFFPRELEFLLNQENILLLHQYVYALFGLMQQIAATEAAFTAALQVLYSLNAVNNFAYATTQFLPQVTGNCTVFALQLALRNAFNLSDEHYYQLILDISKGCDVLATAVRAAPLAEDAVIPADVLYNFVDDTITFPCGYTSIARKKFKSPHATPLYIPAVGAAGIQATNHHVIPQYYLQFLYDKLQGTHLNLLAEVLGKPPAAVNKKQFSYGFFAMFHGPNNRSDDPKTDPVGSFHEGFEKKRPRGFPKSRWAALQGIGDTLEKITRINNVTQYAAQEPIALAACLAHLMTMKSDPGRTQVFSEASPLEIWKADSQMAGKYRLK